MCLGKGQSATVALQTCSVSIKHHPVEKLTNPTNFECLVQQQTIIVPSKRTQLEKGNMCPIPLQIHSSWKSISLLSKDATRPRREYSSSHLQISPFPRQKCRGQSEPQHFLRKHTQKLQVREKGRVSGAHSNALSSQKASGIRNQAFLPRLYPLHTHSFVLSCKRHQKLRVHKLIHPHPQHSAWQSVGVHK